MGREVGSMNTNRPLKTVAVSNGSDKRKGSKFWPFLQGLGFSCFPFLDFSSFSCSLRKASNLNDFGHEILMNLGHENLIIMGMNLEMNLWTLKI